MMRIISQADYDAMQASIVSLQQDVQHRCNEITELQTERQTTQQTADARVREAHQDVTRAHASVSPLLRSRGRWRIGTGVLALVAAGLGLFALLSPRTATPSTNAVAAIPTQSESAPHESAQTRAPTPALPKREPTPDPATADQGQGFGSGPSLQQQLAHAQNMQKRAEGERDSLAGRVKSLQAELNTARQTLKAATTALEAAKEVPPVVHVRELPEDFTAWVQADRLAFATAVCRLNGRPTSFTTDQTTELSRSNQTAYQQAVIRVCRTNMVLVTRPAPAPAPANERSAVPRSSSDCESPSIFVTQLGRCMLPP